MEGQGNTAAYALKRRYRHPPAPSPCRARGSATGADGVFDGLAFRGSFAVRLVLGEIEFRIFVAAACHGRNYDRRGSKLEQSLRDGVDFGELGRDRRSGALACRDHASLGQIERRHRSMCLPAQLHQT